MLEYLSPPLLYRTQLDPSVPDCHFSYQAVVREPNNGRIRLLHIHNGKVYIDGKCVLQDKEYLMVVSYYTHTPLRSFFLLSRDGREWVMNITDNTSFVVNEQLFETIPEMVDFFLLEHEERPE